MADQPGGPEQADLCLRLIRLFPRVVRGMRRWQDRATPSAHGLLGPRHIAALEQLRGGPVTVSELAARLGLTLPTVSGVLAELDRAGFVERHPDPGDRRRTIVEISPARAAVIGQWLDGAASPLARVLDKLSPSEQQAFLKAMNLLETELQSNNSGSAARDDSCGDGQAPAGEAENARARGARRLPGSGAGSQAVVLSRAAGCHGYPPGRRMPRIMPTASSASGSRRSRTAAAAA